MSIGSVECEDGGCGLSSSSGTCGVGRRHSGG
jgi:hypothetical protein